MIEETVRHTVLAPSPEKALEVWRSYGADRAVYSELVARRVLRTDGLRERDFTDELDDPDLDRDDHHE